MGITKFIGLLVAVLPMGLAAPTPADVHPDMLVAMKRDLGLDAAQAKIRVAREISAVDVIESLQSSAGASFAGAWVSDDGATINVAVTDATLAGEVTAAGATPAIVANDLARLEAAKDALDNLVIDSATGLTKRAADSAITAWYVDVVNNKVVLEALPEGTASARDFAAKAGLTETEFEVKEVSEKPTTFATITGGIAYNINGASRCSVGFSVTTGFVTAGHCGRVNAAASIGGASVGTFAGSRFPGADMAFVRTNSAQVLRGQISRSGSTAIPVAGSTVTPIGSSICRSGSTTGVSCGTVQQYRATVNYAQGAVNGLTRTSVCAEPGDSGGSYYTGGQAQGVTSGGSGNCRVGGTTYFQPLAPILSAYGLTLIRG